MEENSYFYCYSTRLFHYLRAFSEQCYSHGVNKVSGNEYWVFKKSDRLDRIIESYNKVKYSFNCKR